MPDQVRHDEWATFYERVNVGDGNMVALLQKDNEKAEAMQKHDPPIPGGTGSTPSVSA